MPSNALKAPPVGIEICYRFRERYKMNGIKLINFIKIELMNNIVADLQRSFRRQRSIERSARINDRFFGSVSYA